MNDRHFDRFLKYSESLSRYRIRLTDLFGNCRVNISLSSEEKGRRLMANRKGVFIGDYVPNHLKESLRRRAAAEHRTLSQEITRILKEAAHGRVLSAVGIDRRTKDLQPLRRASDPIP